MEEGGKRAMRSFLLYPWRAGCPPELTMLTVMMTVMFFFPVGGAGAVETFRAAGLLLARLAWLVQFDVG